GGGNERSLPPAPDTIKAIAVAKSNLLIAAAADDHVVRVYNFADGKELGSVKAGLVRALTFAPGNQALAACADKSLLSWNVPFTAGQPLSPDFLKPIQTFTHGGITTDVLFAADSATLYASSLDKSVQVWKLASPVPTR